MKFPTPVGGVASRSTDLAPSITFAILYGLTIPLIVNLYARKRLRTLVLQNACGVVFER